MKRFLLLILLTTVASGHPARGQSLLVCTLEKDQSVLKHEPNGSLSAKVVKGEQQTLIFAGLNGAKPVLKIGTVELQLELIHTDGDTIWLSSFTPEILGAGLAIWTIDRKHGVVIRSETFKLKDDLQSPSGGNLIALSNIGKCQ
jgi:hypothetical protein